MPAFLAVCALFAALGLALGYASMRFKVAGNPLADEIDALLPQIQCGQCRFPGCRPYAEAVARGEADINQCPPGGEPCVKALARLLGVAAKPLDRARGEQKPGHAAAIDEGRCIGCALCAQACPVDAILGAPKFMHTVIASECTGCDLCLPPCPVDCIRLEPLPQTPADWRWPAPGRSA